LIAFTAANALSIRLGEVVTQFSENANGSYTVKRFDAGEAPEDAFIRWDEATKTWLSGYGAFIYTVLRKLVHTQAAPANPWVFVHNLGTKDLVASIYDATDEQVFADLVTTDLNTVTVTFAGPQTGRLVVMG